MPVRIRPVTPDDVPAVAALVEAGGWGDRRAFFDWAVTHEEAHPLLAELDAAPVATGVGTLSMPVGWIGAVFVDPLRRRSGVGGAITEAICERLERRGARTLALVASRMGQPLYERLGFRETTRYETWEIAGSSTPTRAQAVAEVRRFDPDLDLDPAAALDRIATGEDRGHLLRAFALPDTALAATSADGTLHGFVVRPPFGGGATIADSVDAALALLAHRRLLAGPERQVRAGLPSENDAGRRALLAAGWREAWSAPRMERGEPVGWRPGWIFGQFGMAIG